MASARKSPPKPPVEGQLTPGEFQRRFDPAHPAPVYAIVGEEYLEVREVRDTLRQGILGEAAATPVEFDGRATEAAAFFDALHTPSLFGGRQLVVLENAEEFLRREVDALLKYLERPSRHTVLVLMFKSWSPQWRIARKVTELGLVIACGGLKPAALPAWLMRRAQDYGKTIDREATERLVEHVGASLSRCTLQLEALVTYVGERPRITAQDVETLVGADAQEAAWTLVDATTAREPGRALLVLGRLLRAGEDAPRLIGMLAAKMREVIQVQHLLASGASVGEIARRLGRPTFVVERAAAFAGKSTAAQLRRKFRAIVAADVQSKTSAMPTNLLLENLILRLCGEKTG